MPLFLNKSNTFLSELLIYSMRANIPIYAMFELTYKCNLRCLHCYVSEKPLKKELSFKNVCRIIDQLREANVFWLSFIGGEIFLRKDLFKILSYAKKRNFAIGMTTNGTLLTEKTIDLLRDIGLARINLSLYGLSDSEYKKITGVSGVYEKVLRAIKYLVKMKMPLGILYPVLKENAHNIYKYGRFVKSLGIKDIGLNPFIREKDDGSCEPLLHRVSDHEYEKWVTYLHKGLLKKSEQLLFGEGEGCGAGRSHFTITPYGKLNPCQKSRIDDFDLNKKTFGEWVSSDKFKKFRISGSEFETCKNCDLKSFCIPCAAELLSRDLDKNPDNKYPIYSCKNALIRKKIYNELLKKERRTYEKN